MLIDAGASARSICRSLDGIGSEIGKVAGIFVTHEHSDHIRGLDTLVSKYKIPVFANKGTIRGILSACRKLGEEDLIELQTGDGVEIGGMFVSSFETSHDSNESVGYRVHTCDGRAVGVATDLGYVSETVMQNLLGCKAVVLESNHDVGMLTSGSYPYYLKRRILSDRGHLSNTDCASVLPELLENGTTHFLLAHLSKENNLPELAVQTSVSELTVCGVSPEDYRLEAAPRFEPSGVYTL